MRSRFHSRRCVVSLTGNLLCARLVLYNNAKGKRQKSGDRRQKAEEKKLLALGFQRTRLVPLGG